MGRAIDEIVAALVAKDLSAQSAMMTTSEEGKRGGTVVAYLNIKPYRYETLSI